MFHFIHYTLASSTHLLAGIWPIQRTKLLAQILISQLNKMGQIREPLLHLDSIDCPPDLLHMRRAIYAKLLDQVITFAIGQNRQKHVLDEMRRIGVKLR